MAGLVPAISILKALGSSDAALNTELPGDDYFSVCKRM